MERAARLLNKHKYSRQIIGDDDIVRGLWPSVVGKVIARHTGKITMVRNKLVVEVEDPIWQKQLFCLSKQIVDRMQKLMGSTSVEDVEFRVTIQRKQPQRAESIAARSERAIGTFTARGSDEADGIQDAVLKKVYRLSRKRATA